MDVHQATMSFAVMNARDKLIMECLLEKAVTIPRVHPRIAPELCPQNPALAARGVVSVAVEKLLPAKFATIKSR
jgi:hypothetical protein